MLIINNIKIGVVFYILMVILPFEIKANKDYGQKTSFYELIPLKVDFHLKQLWLEGFFWEGKVHIGNGVMKKKIMLFHSHEALEYARFYDAVEIEFNEKERAAPNFNKLVKSLNGKYVRVNGEFSTKSLLNIGTIRNTVMLKEIPKRNENKNRHP
ncbi:hypothetical protein [Pseudoalteromonas denitrificans]|nr:hypothetical protein [Pseudoalteromonas denitrificans]